MKLLGAAIFACIFPFACATNPEPSLYTPEHGIKAALMNDASLASAMLGAQWQRNPYLAPSGIVRGKMWEFVVVKIEVSIPSEARVKIIGGVDGKDSDIKIASKSLAEMKAFWADWPIDKQTDSEKMFTLKQTYVPEGETVKKGVHRYYIATIAKHPIKRPAMAWVQVAIEGMPTESFEFELPPL